MALNQPREPELLQGRPLPTSISQQHLERFQSPSAAGNAGGLNSAGGRALLHDLDKKFDDQDRMIKYLLRQYEALESQNSTVKQQQLKLHDQDLNQLAKMENQMKYNAE